MSVTWLSPEMPGSKTEIRLRYVMWSGAIGGQESEARSRQETERARGQTIGGQNLLRIADLLAISG